MTIRSYRCGFNRRVDLESVVNKLCPIIPITPTSTLRVETALLARCRVSPSLLSFSFSLAYGPTTLFFKRPVALTRDECRRLHLTGLYTHREKTYNISQYPSGSFLMNDYYGNKVKVSVIKIYIYIGNLLMLSLICSRKRLIATGSPSHIWTMQVYPTTSTKRLEKQRHHFGCKPSRDSMMNPLTVCWWKAYGARKWISRISTRLWVPSCGILCERTVVPTTGK